jgi:hypothetical protein
MSDILAKIVRGHSHSLQANVGGIRQIRLSEFFDTPPKSFMSHIINKGKVIPVTGSGGP